MDHYSHREDDYKELRSSCRGFVPRKPMFRNKHKAKAERSKGAFQASHFARIILGSVCLQYETRKWCLSRKVDSLFSKDFLARHQMNR